MISFLKIHFKILVLIGEGSLISSGLFGDSWLAVKALDKVTDQMSGSGLDT